MKYIEIKSPAKINFGLSIVSKRTDGFHNLETIFYPIYDLFDKIVFEKSDTFSFTCDNNSLALDESNLIIKAIKLLEKTTGLKFNVTIHLEKNIPMGGGLGGGSSNAATTLVCINEMFSLGFQYNKLIELALQLGSDVPFFIKPKPAIGESRGELLTQIHFHIEKPILIVNPDIHISTKEAFKNIVPSKPEYSYMDIPGIWNSQPEKMNGILKNDFEKTIFEQYPEIENIKNKLYDCGAIYASMSGSGSTMYAVFDNIQFAIRTKELFSSTYFKFISLPEE